MFFMEKWILIYFDHCYLKSNLIRLKIMLDLSTILKLPRDFLLYTKKDQPCFIQGWYSKITFNSSTIRQQKLKITDIV